MHYLFCKMIKHHNCFEHYNFHKCVLSSKSEHYYDFWRSCDTEDWSNDAENSALHHRHFKLWNIIIILPFYCSFSSNKFSLGEHKITARFGHNWVGKNVILFTSSQARSCVFHIYTVQTMQMFSQKQDCIWWALRFMCEMYNLLISLPSLAILVCLSLSSQLSINSPLPQPGSRKWHHRHKTDGLVS